MVAACAQGMEFQAVLQTILYAEDEPDIQRIVKLALETVAGFRLIACHSGEEAITRAHEAKIDLILLDVMMPQMDGPTTLKHLREIPALAQTPAVFMTAKAQPNEIAYFKSLGALDVVAKPFDPMTLGASLRAICARTSAEPAPLVAESIQTAPVDLSKEERFRARMAALTEQFRTELPVRLSTLQQQWLALTTQWSEQTLRDVHGSTHNLAGSGSTFGYEELTARARAVDRHVKLLLEQQQRADAVQREDICTLYIALEAELSRIIAELKR